MDPSLQDWYSSQLGHPEASWLASEHQQPGLDAPAPGSPSTFPVELYAFLREDLGDRNRSLHMHVGSNDLPEPLLAAGSSSVGDTSQLATASSAPAPQTVPLLSSSSLSRFAAADAEAAAATRTSSGHSASLRKLLQGRESQKRFRDKQKVRSFTRSVQSVPCSTLLQL